LSGERSSVGDVGGAVGLKGSGTLRGTGRLVKQHCLWSGRPDRSGLVVYYEWVISEDYPGSYWFEYDRAVSPDHMLFLHGKPLDRLASRPTFRLDRSVSLRRLSTFDCLHSDGAIVVSARFADLLSAVAADDVQLFEADVYVRDVQIEGYKVPNISHLVPCLDMETADYEPLLSYLPDGPIRINKAAYVPASLGDRVVVRMLEDNTKIIAQRKLVAACEAARIKGIAFV
jgi:hypothetical protein